MKKFLSFIKARIPNTNQKPITPEERRVAAEKLHQSLGGRNVLTQRAIARAKREGVLPPYIR